MKLKLEYCDYLAKYGLNAPINFGPELQKENIDKIIHEINNPQMVSIIDRHGERPNPSMEREALSSLKSKLESASYIENLLFLPVKHVRLALDKMHRSIGFEFYIGEFPIGEFNAKAVKIPEGYLFLINSGIMLLLNKLIKLHVISIGMSDMTENGYLDIHLNAKTGEYTHEMILSFFIALILEYTSAGFVEPSIYVPRPAGVQLFERAWILNGAEVFIVAHEIAHALCGHLKNHFNCSLETPYGKIDTYTHSQEREIEADLLATEILWQASGEKRENGLVNNGFESLPEKTASQIKKMIGSTDKTSMAFPFAYSMQGVASLFCFLDLMYIIRELKQSGKAAGKTNRKRNHPPPLDRLRLIMNKADELSGLDLKNPFSSVIGPSIGRIS